MTARAFPFLIDSRKSWAQGHAMKHPSVTLALFPLDPFSAQVRLSPGEARAMAVALEAAATYAENVLSTGLGESAVDASAPRFVDVSCSNCGRSFGPGDHGYSHCDQHAGRAGRS